MDERSGTVEGVGIGDDTATIERVFGDAPPYDIYTEITPVDVDSADLTYPREGGCAGPGRENALRYRGVSFLLFTDEACGVTVTSQRASLRRGLGPGDPIARAEELYPELECGETDVGADRPVFEPACAGRVAKGTYVWIGGDPINNVELSSDPLRLSE